MLLVSECENIFRWCKTLLHKSVHFETHEEAVGIFKSKTRNCTLPADNPEKKNPPSTQETERSLGCSWQVFQTDKRVSEWWNRSWIGVSLMGFQTFFIIFLLELFILVNMFIYTFASQLHLLHCVQAFKTTTVADVLYYTNNYKYYPMLRMLDKFEQL